MVKPYAEQSVPLSGNVKDVGIVKTIVHLNKTRKTGTLSLNTSAFTKRIYFKNGDPIFASSSREDDRLGEVLLKAGIITLAEYEKSVEILGSAAKRQGTILVDLGVLSPRGLFEAVNDQVKLIIQSMFEIEEGKYDFYEGAHPTEEIITLKMSTGNLIYEGVKKINNWTKIKNEMPPSDSSFKLSEDPLTLFQDIELNVLDRKVLSLIDGRKTIKETIDTAWMGSFDALKILYVLWSIGMIEETSPATGIPRPDPYEMLLQPHEEEERIFLERVEDLYHKLGSMSAEELLNVDEQTDEEALKKNYYKLTKEYHPDRYFMVADPSAKEKLVSIFDAITSAYLELTGSRS